MPVTPLTKAERLAMRFNDAIREMQYTEKIKTSDVLGAAVLMIAHGSEIAGDDLETAIARLRAVWAERIG